MFHFFESLKKEFGLPKELFGHFNVVLVSNNFLYIEGHKGILKLSQENMTFKVKNGVLVVLGKNMQMKELTQNTVSIIGKIDSFEVV